MNKLREKLRDNDYVLGSFINTSSPVIPEIMGLSGFDFVVIDFEHSSLNPFVAENMVRAAHSVNCSTIIRIADKEPNNISKALDMGVDAVQIPQVSSRIDAEKIVEAAKFYPIGNRGMSHYVRAANYSAISKAKYYSSENNNNLIIVQIEGENAVSELDEILKVKAIDVIFIGPFDLSQSLGVPGKTDHPLVEEKIIEITSKAKEKGKWVGTYVEDFETFGKRVKQGIQLITYLVDVGFLYNACHDTVKRLKKYAKSL